MAKTYFLKNHIAKIDALNDQLWYYLFATDELNRQLNSFSDKAKDNFTIDLFKTNPHSTRIHVKVSSLPKHQKENKNLTFGAYFATCYEISSKYLRTAFDTLKTFNSLTLYNWDNRKEPEKNLISLLNKEGLLVPNVNITDTFTYLRLRRNHFTHIIETPNPKLSGFITATCPSLNTYWQNSGSISNLDFTKSLIRDFTQEETIELIKLVRICIQEIDKHISSLLNVNSVIEHIVKREYDGKTAKLNPYTLKQRVDKIIYFGKTDLGLTWTNTQIEPYATTIGVKTT
jgi:hypothetical protein